MADIIHSFPKGAGGGHTILDTDGQAVAQENKLQFNGLSVTDDSTNGVTEVEGEGLNPDSLDDIAGAQTLVPAVIIGDANNYSTNEKVIGKWIDGKPIYQITVNFGAGPTGGASKTVSVNITNVDSVLKIDAIAIAPDKTSSNPLPFVHGNNKAYDIQIDVRNKTASKFDVLVNCGSSMPLTAYSIYATVQYTKTTD